MEINSMIANQRRGIETTAPIADEWERVAPEWLSNLRSPQTQDIYSAGTNLMP